MVTGKDMAAGKDGINVSVLIVVSVLFAVLTFVLVLLLQTWFYQEQEREQYVKTVAPTPAELISVTAEQEGLLHSYRWVDQEQDVVGIPIERAMKLMVQEAAAEPDLRNAGQPGRWNDGQE